LKENNILKEKAVRECTNEFLLHNFDEIQNNDLSVEIL